MRVAGRIVVAAGLIANALVVIHPIPLAVAQLVVAAVLLTGRGGVAVLATAALLLVPAPVAEMRRLLGHAPLACACQRSSGGRGVGPALGAVADVGLAGLTVWLARRTFGNAAPSDRSVGNRGGGG